MKQKTILKLIKREQILNNNKKNVKYNIKKV